MIILDELKIYLDELLPSYGLIDFCPNGLQVEGKREIKSIATSVSANLETIEQAVDQGVDALIVHHGIFWQKDSYVVQGVKRKKLSLLLEYGISLFAYHLPLDMHPQIGNNWKAARDMGWFDLEPFSYINKVPIGVKGRVNHCTRQELKEQLEAYYNHSAVCAWGGSESIETVALVSGGAYKTIAEAAQEGIGAYITGNFDEPVWHQAKEEYVNFYALGHSATERIGPIALALNLENVFHLPCSFLDVENPF